jgi:hypothetical protein
MNDSVYKSLRGERVSAPNRPGNHNIEPPYARVHEIGLAIIELKDTWRRNDPYLAATATSAQVAPSADVRAHAEAQQFETLVNNSIGATADGINPPYLASDTPPVEPVVAPMPPQQVEQPRI